MVVLRGKTDGTLRGGEFGILKMPSKTAAAAAALDRERARNSFRARGSGETLPPPRRAVAKTRDKLSRNRCVDDTTLHK